MGSFTFGILSCFAPCSTSFVLTCFFSKHPFDLSVSFLKKKKKKQQQQLFAQTHIQRLPFHSKFNQSQHPSICTSYPVFTHFTRFAQHPGGQPAVSGAPPGDDASAMCQEHSPGSSVLLTTLLSSASVVLRHIQPKRMGANIRGNRLGTRRSIPSKTKEGSRKIYTSFFVECRRVE